MTVPKRIQRKRVSGWRMPPNTVYVGRPTKWGNDWKVGISGCETAAEAVEMYEFEMFNEFNISAAQNRDEVRRELRGKNLACWCKEDEPCHADVLLRIANE